MRSLASLLSPAANTGCTGNGLARLLLWLRQTRNLTPARQMGMALPNTATAQELFNVCAAHGGAGWDHSAMVHALELMANHEVGQ